MITVEECINELKRYPMDAMLYAYEGECTGIVIVNAHFTGCTQSDTDRTQRELGFIQCRELWKFGYGPSGLYTIGPRHESDVDNDILGKTHTG